MVFKQPYFSLLLNQFWPYSAGAGFVRRRPETSTSAQPSHRDAAGFSSPCGCRWVRKAESYPPGQLHLESGLLPDHPDQDLQHQQFHGGPQVTHACRGACYHIFSHNTKSTLYGRRVVALRAPGNQERHDRLDCAILSSQDLPVQRTVQVAIESLPFSRCALPPTRTQTSPPYTCAARSFRVCCLGRYLIVASCNILD